MELKEYLDAEVEAAFNNPMIPETIFGCQMTLGGISDLGIVMDRLMNLNLFGFWMPNLTEKFSKFWVLLSIFQNFCKKYWQFLLTNPSLIRKMAWTPRYG